MSKYSGRYVGEGHPFCANCKRQITAARLLFCFSPQQKERFGGRAFCDGCEPIPAKPKGEQPGIGSRYAAQFGEEI